MRVCGSKLLLREHLPFRVDEVPDDRPHFRPVLWGDLTDPAEQVMVVRQRPAGPPAGDEQQQIGAVLLGRQVDRVGQVRVREERMTFRSAIYAPPLRVSAFAGNGSTPCPAFLAQKSLWSEGSCPSRARSRWKARRIN